MKAKIVPVLLAVCPRVYLQGTAPAMVARPYITYYKIAGQSINYVDDAIPETRNGAMQVCVWSERQMEADAMIQQVEDAIRTAKTIQGRPLADAIDAPYEPDTKLCGSIQRFDIWASR
jgi:hypothetical protein